MTESEHIRHYYSALPPLGGRHAIYWQRREGDILETQTVVGTLDELEAFARQMLQYVAEQREKLAWLEQKREG